MAHDRLRESIDAVEDAAIEAGDAIAAVVTSLEGARLRSESTNSLVDVIDDLSRPAGKEVRNSAGRAIERYERGVPTFRGNLVRHVTEGEGLHRRRRAAPRDQPPTGEPTAPRRRARTNLLRTS